MLGVRTISFWVVSVFVFLCTATLLTNHNALAVQQNTLQQAPVFIIGDKILDITRALGYAPLALGTQCTSKAARRFGSQSIAAGCPGKLFRNNSTSFNAFCKKHNLSHLVIEKRMTLCSSSNETFSEKLGIDKGITISQIDFSQGIPQAIEETAQVLGCPQKGKRLAARYAKRLASVQAGLTPSLHGKRVLILYGTYNRTNAKAFVQAQGSAGPEQQILNDLGMMNAAAQMAANPSDLPKRSFMVTRLKHLEKARPDYIVILGHTFAAQKELSRWVQRHPQHTHLVPAIANNAIFTLPPVGNRGLLRYPETLKLWNWAMQ